MEPRGPGQTFGIFDLSPIRREESSTSPASFSESAARPGAISLRSASRTAGRPVSPRTRTSTITATAPSRPSSPRARSTWGIFSRVGGLPRDSFARLDPVTGRARTTVVSPICPTALAASGSRLYAATNIGCAASKGPLRALALPDLKPIAWTPQLPHEDVEALAAAPGLVVAVSSESRFEAGPRTITGLDDRGRRVFTSPLHPRDGVEALAASNGIVLVGTRS